MRKFAFLLSVFLIFTIPWEGVRIAGFGSTARLAGLIAGGFWLATILATGKFSRPRPFHLLILLFILWNLTTLLWSVDINSTLDRSSTYLQLLVMSYLLYDLFNTPEKIRIGLQAYVIGSYVSVFSTISNYLTGVDTGRGYIRYSGFGFNENVLAFILTLGIPVAWYLVVSASMQNKQENTILKFINFAYLPLGLFAILLTANRTAVFSLIPVILLIAATIPRLRLSSRILISIGLTLTIFGVQAMVPQTSIDRLATVGSELGEDGDLSGRENIWDEAINVFLERPLTGYGSGAFKTAVNFKNKASHSLFINLLLETGIVGTLFFGAIFLAAIYHTRYLSRLERVFWLTMFAVWAIGNYTSGWEWRKQTWLFFTLIIASANIELQRFRTKRPPPYWLAISQKPKTSNA